MISNNGQKPPATIWHVLICGLPIAEDNFDLSEGLTLEKLSGPLNIFNLAKAGAAGFHAWSALDIVSKSATCQISSQVDKAAIPGFDALDKCWLVSAMLVLRGFAVHIVPACSNYSWDKIASSEEIPKLPKFHASLLDYHIKVMIPKDARADQISESDAKWMRENFSKYNQLCVDDKFRFALAAAYDWRYAKDERAAIARLWSGIESIFNFTTELSHRLSLYGAVAAEKRGPERYEAYKKIRKNYSIRSAAVHGNSMSEEELSSGMSEAFYILRSLIFYCVSHGKVPDENSFLTELLS